MKTSETIHLAFSINLGYWRHLNALLISILENNRDLDFCAHIMTDVAPEKIEKPLHALQKKYDNIRIDVMQIDDKQFEGFALPLRHITVQSYYRCLLPKLFPQLDKILYLDSDTIVCGRLEELWNESLDGYYAAGVVALVAIAMEIPFLDSLGFHGRNDYVNAGVLLLNLKAAREDDLVEKLFSCQQIIHDKIKFLDQDIINVVMMGRIKLLPLKYNVDTYSSIHDLSQEEPVIVHYTGADKPWSSWNGGCHKHRREYLKYARMMPNGRCSVFCSRAKLWIRDEFRFLKRKLMKTDRKHSAHLA